ncbi:MAG: Asp23/Gls24 family envelope stress response protein [Chloroflexi bacterium]|nr:Asp23/Gls24 family envelope stress response protein [Chloroflexota bacterium]MBU1746566.1 Asp23/Gls24 family envelope stress response protein [Chloroflexota bacterium]
MNDQRLGKIEVSPHAIATIAGHAVMSCYGVVGMATTTLKDGLTEILQQENYGRGVKVHLVEDQIIIDLYVVIEYGVRISEVAQNIMISVKYAVERSLGLPVIQVNVYVQGLRVSDGDRRR